MGVLDVVNAGVLTGSEAKKLFAYAKKEGFAIPAVNVVGTDSINAVLEAASKVKSPVIVQFSNGGFLGKFAAEQMVPEFANAVKMLQKGGFSKSPVKSQFGYHVILLKDKFPGKNLAYNEVQGEIEQVLIGNSFGKKVKELIDNLRKDAKIVIK